MKNKYSTNPNTAFDQHDEQMDVLMQEEAHYVHTMNAFVELIVVYGWDKVTSDLRSAMGEKQW
jgi:hypothetical protein